MRNSPLISVIMPVFNSEKYLAQAIESILGQTFTDFEFLIFDDGSTDRSAEIIKTYAARDARIIADFSPINKGYVVHLNEGIQRARGTYIARMDSDDISLPERLEMQKAFLDEHPGVGIVGSSSHRIDQDGVNMGLSRRKQAPSYLFWQSFFSNPFSHPTVMYRRGAVLSVGGYNEAKMPAEDYDLWLRLLPEWGMANIEEPLLKYREHPASISIRDRDMQVRNSCESLIALWWSQLRIKITSDEVLFLKGYHKGYDRLPKEVAYSMFVKLWTLRRATLARYSVVDDEVHRDAFRRCIYLATRTKSTSVSGLMSIAGHLVTTYPRYVTKLLFHGGI